MKDQALAARCRDLRLVLTDVDGVMTDGTILLLPGGGGCLREFIEAILRAREQWDGLVAKGAAPPA